LAKGLLAFAFWIVACAVITARRRRWSTLRLFNPLAGLGIVAAVVLPWVIAVERANPGFVQYFLFNENLKRVLDTRWPPDYSISKISPWGYVVVTALWCIPWILMLMPALLKTWRSWRESGAAGSISEPLHYQDALMLIAVLAALPILLFLPLSSRLYYYSIPALPPLAMLAGQWWATLEDDNSQRARNWIGWSMATLGTAITTSLIWLPQSIVGFFPELSQTDGVETIVIVILIGLGVGFVGTGWCMVRRQMAVALVLLWLGFGTSWACMVQGFKTVEDFRSSKTLIQTASQHLGPETLWIFEGSRELGAAGAMSFYLGPSGYSAVPTAQPKLDRSRSDQSKSDQSNSRLRQLDPSAPSKTHTDLIFSVTFARTPYPTIYVLSDGGANRLPPSFPGPKPKILISKAEMQKFWNRDHPVVFVTDFLRMPNDPDDPPERNLPREAGQPLLEIGPRKLYGNAIAQKLWLQ
jgi:4-amino-4-deoxy-L-arabinose transferase-like glycosyltransferase